MEVHLEETKISRVHLEFPTSVFQRRSYCDQPSSFIDVAVLPASFVDEFRKDGWIDWSNKTKTDLKADLFLEAKNLLLPGYVKSQPGYCRTGVEKDIQKLRNCLACEWTKSAVVFVADYTDQHQDNSKHFKQLTSSDSQLARVYRADRATTGPDTVFCPDFV